MINIPVGVSIPISLAGFNRNLSDTRRLLELGEPRKLSAGEKRKASEVVSRSAVVLICASWEAFLEDLALDGLSHLLARELSGAALPEIGALVVFRARRCLQGEDLSAARNQALRNKREAVLGIFNTPKAANIEALFNRVFEIDRFTRSWRWSRVSSRLAAQQLDDFVTLRGDIAHRTRGLERVTRKRAKDFLILSERLAVLTCNSFRDWLQQASGQVPWGRIPLAAIT